jgi:hypothetical protein
MKELLPLVQSYTKNSASTIEELKTLHIPENALLFSADATSMYTNIDTSTGIAAISDFIQFFEWLCKIIFLLLPTPTGCR